MHRRRMHHDVQFASVTQSSQCQSKSKTPFAIFATKNFRIRWTQSSASRLSRTNFARNDATNAIGQSNDGIVIEHATPSGRKEILRNATGTSCHCTKHLRIDIVECIQSEIVAAQHRRRQIRLCDDAAERCTSDAANNATSCHWREFADRYVLFKIDQHEAKTQK